MTEATFYPSGEIAGLTDRPRLVRLGKIRLGIKKLSARGNEYPVAVDHFVCPPEVVAVYGDKPRELDIMFPDDDVSRVAGAAYKMYTATRGKVCTSDGATAVRLVDEDVLAGNPSPTQDQLDRALVKPESKNWSRRTIPCPNSECRFFQDNQCKPVMNLMFVLYKVAGIGVYQLDTGSYNSIVDVRGGIELVKRITNGRLRGVPLKLRVKPTAAYPEGKRKNVFTLELISMEKLEALAEFGEKTLHDVFLPLTEGRETPRPTEPEEDLFPDAITVPARSAAPSNAPQGNNRVDGATVRAAADNARTSGGGSSDAGAPPRPDAERDRSPVEVAGSTPAPRSAPEDEMAIAAEVESLFHELGLVPKDRELWRRFYKGRPRELRAFLQKEKTKREAKK